MSTRYFIDQDNRYVGAFADGASQPEDASEVPVAPEDTQQVWNGDAWHWPLVVLKARKQLILQARFTAALDSGMAYGGRVLQIREADQQNITAMGQEARWALANNTAWPPGFAWRMADNSFLPLTQPADMIALGEAAKTEVYRLQLVKWAHADAIDAAADPAILDSIDIDSGW